MSLCLPISTRRGAMVHMAQSLVGKVLSSCAMTPPMAGPRSAKYTLMPAIGEIEGSLHTADTASYDKGSAHRWDWGLLRVHGEPPPRRVSAARPSA